MRTLTVPGLGEVGRVGLGAWQFGSREWGYGSAYAEGEAATIVRRALELGVTLFDTAEIYGQGRSETILGAALGDQRTEVEVATKLFPVAPFPRIARRRAESSARRLRLDRLPLYQVHWPNPVVSDAVIMPGLKALQDDGLVGAVGVSNYPLERWQAADRALGAPVVSNQVQFSLVRTAPSSALVPFAERERRMIMAYSPLAQGLLGGRYDEDHRPSGFRARLPLFSTESLRRARPLIDALREVAAGRDATPGQVALAWLLHWPQVMVIPGASSVEQLESNVAAAAIDLADDEFAALSAAAEAFTPQPIGEAVRDGVAARFARVLRRTRRSTRR